MSNNPAGELTWHFVAKNVIDFAWAADPDYAHDRVKVPNGPELHFFYQKDEKTTHELEKTAGLCCEAFSIYEQDIREIPL